MGISNLFEINEKLYRTLVCQCFCAEQGCSMDQFYWAARRFDSRRIQRSYSGSRLQICFLPNQTPRLSCSPDIVVQNEKSPTHEKYHHPLIRRLRGATSLPQSSLSNGDWDILFHWTQCHVNDTVCLIHRSLTDKSGSDVAPRRQMISRWVISHSLEFFILDLGRCLKGSEEEAFGRVDNKSEVLKYFTSGDDEQVETLGRSIKLVHTTSFSTEILTH